MNVVVRVILGFAVAHVLTEAVSAGVEDSRFEISPNGSEVVLELRDVPRRYVLERLFAGNGPAIEWANSDIRDELVGGNYSGSRWAVARQLLEATDFILTTRVVNGETRIVRVLILGKANTDKLASGSTALDRSFAENKFVQEANNLPPPVAIPNEGLVPPVTPGGPTPTLSHGTGASATAPSVSPATVAPPTAKPQ